MPFRSMTWDHNEVARWLYIIVVILAAAAMAILFVLINNDRASIHREANIRATQIQQQRYDATFRTCIDTNQRNKETVSQLKGNIKRYIRQHPARRAQAEASLEETISLINALVPVRDCKAVAQRAVHPLVNPEGK